MCLRDLGKQTNNVFISIAILVVQNKMFIFEETRYEHNYSYLDYGINFCIIVLLSRKLDMIIICYISIMIERS